MKSCPFRSLVVVAIVILGAIFSRNFRHNSPVAHNKAASIKNFENSTKEAKVIHKIEKLVL